MKCLIAAAGQGTRLRARGESKPLIHLRQRPLIEHVIERACRAGVSDFYVVSGYRGEQLRAALASVPARFGVRMTHIVNDEWDRANGVSVTKAAPHIEPPFILTMCDHLVDPAIFRTLASTDIGSDEVGLGVDFNVDSPLNDPDDVTRVKCTDGRIENIGKVIREFNAVDTGVFWCSGAMFDALAESQAAGDDSISGGMKVLARRGKARAVDIGDRVWIDVDDPAAFEKAERLIDDGRL